MYLNPQDFVEIQASAGIRKPKSSETIPVKIKNFYLRAGPLESIQIGSFGASSFHREMFEISKLDSVAILYDKEEKVNPLAELTLVVDYKLLGREPSMVFQDDGMCLQLSEELVASKVQEVFSGRSINLKERFVLPLYGDKCMLICFVEALTPISV